MAQFSFKVRLYPEYLFATKAAVKESDVAVLLFSSYSGPEKVKIVLGQAEVAPVLLPEMIFAAAVFLGMTLND